MSVLTFMNSGGMATKGGDLEEAKEQRITELVKAFGITVKKIAIANNIPPSALPVWKANFFYGAIDMTNVYIFFADGSNDNVLHFNDLSKYGTVEQDSIAADIRDHIGEPIFGFSMFKNVLDRPATNDELLIGTVAQKYIDGIISDMFLKDIPNDYKHFAPHLKHFFREHPSYENNVFLMMRFDKGELFQNIENTIRREAEKYGLNIVRADKKDFTGDLWDNVCLYMLGSKYGIVVFDQIDERDFNPSVSIELGFMTALNKRCLILKDKRMPNMPTDIIGKLYKEFDTYHIDETITKCMANWAYDIGVIPAK